MYDGKKVKMPVLNVVAVYLAAGSSKRMGSNKLLLPFRNGCLGSKALQAAVCSKVNHTIVVTKKGDNLEWIEPILFFRSISAEVESYFL